jgi:hypothetical protein
MSAINPFQKPLNEYQFDLDYINGYIHQHSMLLSRKLNQPYEKIKQLVTKQVKEKFKDRAVTLYKKDLTTLDMEKTTMPLTQYVYSIEKEKLTLAPSFTCYTKVDKDGNPWVSMHSKWTDVNKRSRNEFKKKAKQFEAVGDKDNFIINNTLNVAAKTKNNSLSGKYSLLKYPTSRHSSHYSLTSFTRLVTSTANTLSESIVMGNRLYYNPMDVIRHIGAIISYTDITLVEEAVKRYKLAIPSTRDIMDMVLYNTYYYWRNEQMMDKIHGYVESLNEYERCAYLYTFDMYHLHKLNQPLIETLLTSLSTVHENITNDMKVVTSEEDYKVNLLHHVCYDELKGKGIKYGEFDGKPIAGVLASTMTNINKVLGNAELLIKAFFMSRVMPPNASSIKDAVRRAIVLSDTDSTVSFYYHYISKKYGTFELNRDSIAYAASTSIFVSESIRNVLIQLGKNMNVEEDVMCEIDMKSEYMFSTFIPSFGSKHYIEKTIIKELIQQFDKIGFHGVSLIANKILKKYTAKKEELVAVLIDGVESGNKLDLSALIEFIKMLEREILEMIKSGDQSIFMFSDIKDKGAYKKPISSPYYHYMLWEEVFAETYGHVENPPYLAMKVSIIGDTHRRFMDTVKSIANEDIRNKWLMFLEKIPKDKMTQLIIPYDIVNSNGIPDEIFSIIDKNKIVIDVLQPFYTVLETVGIVSRDGEMFLEQF